MAERVSDLIHAGTPVADALINVVNSLADYLDLLDDRISLIEQAVFGDPLDLEPLVEDLPDLATYNPERTP